MESSSEETVSVSAFLGFCVQLPLVSIFRMATLLSRFRIQCEKMTILSDIGRSPSEERSVWFVISVSTGNHCLYHYNFKECSVFTLTELINNS